MNDIERLIELLGNMHAPDCSALESEVNTHPDLCDCNVSDALPIALALRDNPPTPTPTPTLEGFDYELAEIAIAQLEAVADLFGNLAKDFAPIDHQHIRRLPLYDQDNEEAT